MENDLRATDRKSKGIQRSVAFEYPVIPDVRLQQLTGFVKYKILLNHIAKVFVLVVSCLLQDSFLVQGASYI